MKRKWIRIASALLALWFLSLGVSYWSISKSPPWLLVSTQVFRPNSGLNRIAMPKWLIDLHWRISGSKRVDAANHASTEIVHFMLGAELSRADGTASELDVARFRELMKRYVCAAPQGIPLQSDIEKFSKPERASMYVDALHQCGRRSKR